MASRRAPARSTKPRAASSIAAPEQLLALTERMSDVGCWRFDFASHEVTWTDQVYRIHGVTRQDYVPNLDATLAFYHPDDRATVEQSFARVSSRGGGFGVELR